MINRCKVCRKTFDRQDALVRHSRIHFAVGDHACSNCCKTFDRADHLKNHIKRKHPSNSNCDALNDRPPIKLWRPWENDVSVSTSARREETNLEPNLDTETDNEGDPTEFQQVTELIKAFDCFICTKKVKSARLQDRYNYRTNNPSRQDLLSYITDIYEDQKSAFKLNLAFGFILRHIQTGKLVFYYASTNNKLLDKPSLVQKSDDLQRFLEIIDNEDLLEYCRLQRPNSSYTVVTITNILFYVDKLKEFPIGCGVTLPHYVRSCRAIISLERDHHGALYTDNLCLFRCLALARGLGLNTVTTHARNYLNQWLRFTNKNLAQFVGVTSDDLDTFETCFAVRVEVYALEDVQEEDALGQTTRRITASHLRRSVKDKSNPLMNLNLFENHFSYIKDLQSYCRNWKCGKCEKLFALRCRCVAHERNCINKTKVVFKGGGFGPKKTIFDDLTSYGISVRPEDFFFPNRISFDFEAFIKPVVDQTSCPRGTVNYLTPASVAVCSNVVGHETPECFVINETENTSVLMGEFFTYIQTVSATSFVQLSEKFKYVTDQLDEKLEELAHVRSLGDTSSSHEKEELHRLSIYEHLKARLLTWMRRIVVLGFNSQKFDINLIRSYLFPYLLSNNIPIRSIIKKGSSYHCICLDDCMFLDMRNYLSPTVSYGNWIKSLGIEDGKLWFPYESVKTVSDLDRRGVPPKDAFWSSLKRCGISDEDYANLRELWTQNGFQTLRDLLIMYNIQDVKPFIQAAEKYFDHWKALGIDPFKSGSISLPGLALTHLMKTLPKHVVLPLISAKHEDVYYCIRRNIVGGLSAVFHRYHEVDVTTLPNGMKVKLIVSKDANGLYLYCLALETGTGIIILWRSTSQGVDVPVTRPNMSTVEISQWEMGVAENLDCVFDRQSMYPRCHQELHWLEWYAASNSCIVCHRFNGGQKVIIKSKTVKYPVDGYVAATKTVLQFHGCYWHGHACSPNIRPNPQRLQETGQITQNLRSMGYTVIEMWECDWKTEKRNSPVIRQFIQEHFSLPASKAHLTGHELLECVKSGTMFGLIECDIEVPRFDPVLEEYFKEFPPIFKNVEVGIDHIGDFMKDFALRNDLMKKPRRCMISSYFGKKILLPTPLVRWLLEKQLRITRIHQFMQMKPKRCFQHLSDEVSRHRRAADADPSLKPIGSTWKDTGNHYYGKTATDMFKFKNVKVAAEPVASKLVNNKRFCSMEEVGGHAYEVTMDKTRINVDLPITVAFFVYGAAKLRMLEMYYDFLKRFLTPGSFQLTNMDTDSFVMALGSKNIADLVEPHLRAAYEIEKSKFLVTDAFSLRTPGLFKDELLADGIIALCAKTYFAWGAEYKKAVSKGLSKVTNDLSYDDYNNVLVTGQAGGGVNCGFRAFGEWLIQYEQLKRAISFFYIKRKVRSDAISTDPLDL